MRKRDDERRRKDPFPWPDGHWWVQVVGYALRGAMIGGAAFVTYLLYLQIKAGAPMH